MNAYLSPTVFPYFNLLSLSFPFLLLLNIVLCLFWIILRKKRAFVFLGFSLFFILPTLRWVNYKSPKKDASSIKVISFNSKGVSAVEDYLNAQEADIVFLQEFGVKKSNEPKVNLPYQTDYDWLLTIHTRYKIVEQGMLLDSPDCLSKIQYADVIVQGKRIRLVNMYLEPYSFEKKKIRPDGSLGRNEAKAKFIIKKLLATYKIHAEQVGIIRDFIKKSPYPVLLAGDANSVPNSYEYYQLSKNLQDAFVVSGKGSATSFHDYKFPIRIDFVFSSPSVIPLSYKVDRSIHLSDHFPVISTFKIN
jgi:hypothetical protein